MIIPNSAHLKEIFTYKMRNIRKQKKNYTLLGYIWNGFYTCVCVCLTVYKLSRIVQAETFIYYMVYVLVYIYIYIWICTYIQFVNIGHYKR